MKKRFLVLFLVLAIVLTLGIVAIATDGEETGTETETITIYYVNSNDTTNDTTSLDTTAYSGGKQTVGKGEEFTLPTTTSASYVGEEGYQLVWYTEDGRTYKAGESVSFDKDTKLYRCVAKEVYTMAELNTAMTSGSSHAILMADITSTVHINVWDQGSSILVLNGFNINITLNGGIMGGHRSGKHVYGEGTMNITNTDGSVGKHYVFNNQSHGYNGSITRTVVGRDVTINAPNFWLSQDWDGSHTHYPWLRVYGTVNVYGLVNFTDSGNRNALIEIYENANVTITGPSLFKDITGSGNQYYFNNQGVEFRVYGGTFNLPQEAAELSFWTNDYTAEYTIGTAKYTPKALDDKTKDKIKIDGGSFNLPNNAVPPIQDYLTEDYVSMMHVGGNGLLKNNNTSTYFVPYYNRAAYRLEFTTYSSSALGTLKVRDQHNQLIAEYRYTATKNSDGTALESIIVYEASADGTTYETVTDDFSFSFGLNSILFTSPELSKDKKLHNFEANNLVYQTVVPADCEHNFTGAPVDATCAHKAYADYNCPACGHNVYFSWGEKVPHAYEATSTIAPTTTTHGSSSFECSMCNDSKTYATTMDPTNFDVAVTIKNDDGTFEKITALASDVFEFSTIGGNGAYIYTLSGIKAFGEYNIRNIYGVVIPNGIMYVNIETQNLEKYNSVNQGLEVLEITENSVIAIQNIGNLSCLTTIKVGKGTNITFEPNSTYYNPNNERRSTSMLARVDFSAGDMYVKAMTSAFHDRPIAELLLGENSTYDFQYQSFRNTKITELIIPETSTVIFGANSFYDADITSLEFPSGTAEALKTWNIGNDCFRNNPITEITFGEYGTYSLGSSAFNGTKVTTVTLAPNSSYTINSWCFSSSTITKLDASAGNITLTVNGSGLRNLTNVTEFKLGENSTYYFAKESLGTTTYTSLVIPKNSKVTFVEYFLSGNTTFKEIDASAENVTVSFNSNSFNGITTFDTLKLGKNATLTFSDNCFKGTALTGLDLQEGATITFNGYCLRSVAITEVNIPKSSNVTFASNAFRESNVEKLTFGADSSYTFNNGSFNYATIFTEFIFGENTTCLFKDWVFNTGSTVQKIDLSADNTNATFNGSAIRNSKTITTVLLNGNNSTYIINSESFRNIATLETFEIDGEGSSYTFKSSNSLTDLPKLTVLTLGKDSTYNFEQWVVGGTTALQKLDASADGVNVTFGQNSFRQKTTLTELLINGKNATYTFISEAFRDSSNITGLVLGQGSTYDFRTNSFMSVSNLASIDASASNITATFGREVFNGRSTITYLAFGENSTYTIDYRAFYNCSPTNDVVFSSTSTFNIGFQAFYSNDFASITFEDDCEVTFTGTEAFKDCDKTTSLYIGKNIAVTNYPFKNLKALQELYIMSGVTTASEWEFENAGSSDFSTPLYVYNHSTNLEFRRGMFKNCDGIVLYTVTDNIGTRTDVFVDCADGTDYKAWTVYLGIPYPELTPGVIDPSCEEYGYDTYVCNCGHDCGFYLTETTAVNKYENKHNITDTTEYVEQTTYEVTPIEPLGHDTLGTLLDVVYNSFVEKGTGTYVCSACGETHTVENAVDAIFEWLGYSTNGDKSEFAIGYRINHEALSKYEEITGNKIAYGVVGAVTEKLGGLAPFDEALDSSVKVVSYETPREFESGVIAEICFRVKGFTSAHYDLGMTMAGYVTETVTDEEGNESSTTVYIQSTQTNNPSSNTINNYLASLPADEEEDVA